MKKMLITFTCIALAVTASAQTAPGIAAAELQADGSGYNEMESRLSTLWTAVTLNMITADVLSLFIPEGMDEWEDFANGNEKELMLGGAIMYQIPISMVFLSKMLPHRANRWANMVAAGLMTAAVIGGGSTEPHYIACATAEVACMGLIAWNAYKWTAPDGTSRHSLSTGVESSQKAYGLTYAYRF